MKINRIREDNLNGAVTFRDYSSGAGTAREVMAFLCIMRRPQGLFRPGE
jgi:hypothetical protein